MKKVVPPSEVAHLWANKIQSEARTPTNNFYFYDGIIYSYGSHFPIAKHVTNSKGETAVLFTLEDYSNTTSKHKAAVRHACNHLNNIYVWSISRYSSDNDENTRSNFTQWENEIKDQLEKLPRARKPELYLTEVNRIYSQVKAFADFFNIEVPESITALTSITGQKQFVELAKEHQKQEAAKQKQLLISQRAKYFERLKEWKTFEKQFNMHRCPDGFDYLRYNQQNNEVETTQGVRIEANEARKFYQFILRAVNSGGCKNCNYRISHFSVTEINEKFIQVGCHKITIDEIRQFTHFLGWDNIAA